MNLLPRPWAQACALTTLALLTAGAQATGPAPTVLTLFDGQPAAGLRLNLADVENETPFNAPQVTVPKTAKPLVPQSDVRASRQGDTVTMRWRDAWHALLRLDAERPMDLRAFVEQGTLAFEVKVGDLSRAGLSVSMNCGPDCSRRLNLVVASRGWAGQGWQKVALPLRCFVRDGADFSAVTRPFVLESSGTGEVEVGRVRLVTPAPATHSCPDYRTQSVTPAPLQEVWAMDWWMPRHQKKLDDIRAAVATGQAPRLVFIGDSITQGWEEAGAAAWATHFAGHRAIALGYGGDRTENALWRLQHGELDGYRAEAVVLMIGTNNTGDRQEDPATTAAGVRRLLDEVQQRQPQAKVLLLAVFPRDPKPGTRLRTLNQQLNQRLAAFADGQRVVFMDIGAQLMNADGTLSPEVMPDWLHLSPEGYARWARAIAPALNLWLGQPRP
jgi:beta-glucosidase